MARLPSVTVGLEGCESAFNALNAVRTTQFFGTSQPPVFMSLRSWNEVANLQIRHVGSDSLGMATAKLDNMALFGRHTFLHELNTSSPLVALENFTPRAESLLHRRVPSHARLVVGHENRGVDSTMLRGSARGEAHGVTTTDDTVAARVVLYIPQYGTVSSLNVVTALGIALFYAFLDQHHPRARTPLCELGQTASPAGHAAKTASRAVTTGGASDMAEQASEASAVAQLRRTLQIYQSAFNTELPRACGEDGRDNATAAGPQPTNCTSPQRLDARPIHPMYYKKGEAQIRAAHQAFRRRLLDFSNAERRECGLPARHRFGLSVLYENVYDRRNFGGLMRNANAFLVDAVCYVGRRKCNVVGAIGCYHYTPPHHIPCDLFSHRSGDEGGGAVPASDVVKGDDHALRAQVERVCGGPCRWWLLDCGHTALYETAPCASVRESSHATSCIDDTGVNARYSSAASLAWYAAQWAHAPERVISLCDDETTLRQAAGDGLLLLVPQEGRLPHISLLSQCERVVTVLPSTLQRGQMAGLPSQVASGIALQRLSAVLHPGLRLL